MKSLFDLLARATLAIAATSLCALVLILAWQVFGRYVLNDSPGWTEPVALTLMGVAALFGAALAVRLETHFSFPTLLETSPPPVRAALKALGRIIAVIFGGALALYGGMLMADAWDTPMAGAPMPEGVSFVGVCVGGALITIFGLERLFSGDPEKKDA